jgi:hypothetical protein
LFFSPHQPRRKVMIVRLLSVASLAALLAVAPPVAADPPPQDAIPLSEILRSLEEQGDVAYFDEVEWDDDGYWEIEYVTADGAKRKLEVDPVTGEQRG